MKARHRILTAMSLVYDAFARDIIPDRLKSKFIKIYNKLQQLRDNEIVNRPSTKQDPEKLENLKSDRIVELCKTPFNLKAETANKYENSD